MSVTHVTIATAGRQFRVKPGDTILVNRLSAAVGDAVSPDKILLAEKEDGDIQLSPNLTLTATVVEHLRGPKLRIFKMRRRKKSRTSRGHRQDLTRLKIGEIKDGSA